MQSAHGERNVTSRSCDSWQLLVVRWRFALEGIANVLHRCTKRSMANGRAPSDVGSNFAVHHYEAVLLSKRGSYLLGFGEGFFCVLK
jgi:hypothetical protein